MKSKITKVTGNGTYKDLFSFEYEFEDGNVVNFNHKENTPKYKVGEEVEYKIDYEKDEWKKGSFVQSGDFKPQQPTGDNLKGIKIGHAITNAVSLVCAHGHGDYTMEGQIKIYAKMIYQISEELNNEL